jgi:hypothetical protein
MSLLDALLEDELLRLSLNKTQIYIAIRTDGAIGEGTLESPYDGSTPDKLWTLFLTLQTNENTRFIFGPGIFSTWGGQSSANYEEKFWFVRNGQEFIGSGMNQTTFRLVVLSPNENETRAVFGASLATSDVVISDMTIDADTANQPPTPGYNYTRMTLQGIGLRGSNIHIRRVRFINFGPGTPYFEYGYRVPVRIDGRLVGNPNGWECFPISLAADFNTLESPNNKVEECIFERPFKWCGRETTCATIGGGFSQATGQRAFHLGPQTRNNLVDGKWLNPGPFEPIRVVMMVFTGTEAAFRTATQHDLRTGDKVTISGATPSGANGAFTVNVIDQWTASYECSEAPGTDWIAISGVAPDYYNGTFKAKKFSDTELRYQFVYPYAS